MANELFWIRIPKDAVPSRPRLTPPIADVRRAVRETLRDHQAVAGDLILVACSGGPDSLALAAALAFEGPRAGWKIASITVDHQMQAGSAEVAQQTVSKLQALGYESATVATVQVGKAGGPEAAAREARYLEIENHARLLNAKFVLLGHTLDDQAETVLLGLARGSGARSLNGMAVRNGIYLRPLLRISRETVQKFCEDSGLQPWLDPMNHDLAYTRVRVRNVILPMLENELGPGISLALTRTADSLREDDEVLSQLADAAFSEVARLQATQIIFSVPRFKDLPIAIRHRVFALALQKLAAPEFARVHILAVDALVDDWHGQKPLTLPGVRVERTGESITLKTTKTLKSGAC